MTMRNITAIVAIAVAVFLLWSEGLRLLIGVILLLWANNLIVGGRVMDLIRTSREVEL